MGFAIGGGGWSWCRDDELYRTGYRCVAVDSSYRGLFADDKTKKQLRLNKDNNNNQHNRQYSILTPRDSPH